MVVSAGFKLHLDDGTMIWNRARLDAHTKAQAKRKALLSPSEKYIIGILTQSCSGTAGLGLSHRRPCGMPHELSNMQKGLFRIDLSSIHVGVSRLRDRL